jgi:hypothetical protein
MDEFKTLGELLKPVTRKEYEELFLALTRLTDRIEAMENAAETFDECLTFHGSVMADLAKDKKPCP